MIIRTCAFTTQGWKLLEQVEKHLAIHCYEKREPHQELDAWVREGFAYHAPILFVGAVGIAVRKIAPYITDKLTDSPVIVMEETGKFVIPILADHIGGAGELAKQIAQAIGAQAVVTTATDVRGMFSIDVFARKNGLHILQKEGIQRVSAKLLQEGHIRMAIEPGIAFQKEALPEEIHLVEYQKETADVIIQTGTGKEANVENGVLELRYKPYVLGVGCKRDTSVEKLEEFIKSILNKYNINISEIASAASIDLKRKEKGLLYFSSKNGIPFSFYSAEALAQVEGSFSESEFVKRITGIANVCERAALKQAGERAELLLPKTAQEGVTVAISKRKARITTWETSFI